MQHNDCDVIVTYCWNRVGYAIVRSLSSHGLKVWVADTSKTNICSVSKYSVGSFVYPDYVMDEEAFINCLLLNIERLKPKMLLPTHDESVVIMRHRGKFPQDLIIPYGSEKMLLLLANKAKATETAGKIGIPIPKVYHSVEEVKNYPVVFKTVIGNSAKGVYFPKNKGDLVQLMKQHKDEETLLEEWVGGTDYSVDCVRWKDFWKSSVYRAIVTKTDGGGTTTQREIVSVPKLEEQAKLLLDAVDFHGVCGMDFRYDPKTGQTAFIEVNARFTGGLVTPITAGFDIPWIVYKLSTEGRYDESINIKVGTRTKWILGDLITLVSRLLTLKWNAKEMKQVFSFSDFDAFDDYDKDDKKAIWGEVCYYFEKFIKNGKLNP